MLSTVLEVVGLLTVPLLVGLNAFFVAAEFSLVTVRWTRVEQLVEEKKIDAALFLGDDVSDLNAFKAARQMRTERICEAWGVGVQSEDAPEALADTADFLADGVEDVEDLLAWLLKARKASST